jgi:hypothetical protein
VDLNNPKMIKKIQKHFKFKKISSLDLKEHPNENLFIEYNHLTSKSTILMVEVSINQNFFSLLIGKHFQ